MKEEWKKSNLWKARNRIKRLAQANFVGGNKSITLTFGSTDFDSTDIAICNTKYTLFIRRLTRKFKGLRYITVLEFQKRGAVHYHILCNLPYVKKSELQQIWSHGFVQINQVRDTHHIVNYISKYMMKYADDPRFEGHRRYFCSTKLVKPQKMKPYETEQLLEKIVRSGVSPIAFNRYFSQFYGLIATEQYNVDDFPSSKGDDS